MDKVKTPLKIARIYAEGVIEALKPHCKRIEIAGSIRRGKPEVGDIEIVAIPLISEWVDMFGVSTGTQSHLDLFPYTLFGKLIKDGHRYKQIEMRVGINLDLFIVIEPAQWGVLFMIRTGPADFSRKMVTQKSKGGYLPDGFHVKDGVVWAGGTRIQIAEEIDYFDLCEMKFIPPEERSQV